MKPNMKIFDSMKHLKKMNRISSVLLLLTMVFVLASCAKTNDGEMSELNNLKEEIWCGSEGSRIFGQMYLPGNHSGKLPTVILSHSSSLTHAARLTRLWRDHDGRRVVHEGTLETLRELTRRGYKLGIIANTITETEIPDWMCRDQVADCFKTVILSSKVRLRKPDPAIYLLAARCIGSTPENCAYVGDNPVRDVEGAKAAGFGAMVLFEDAGTADREGKAPTVQPDFRIKSIPELLELFPPRQ